MNDQPRDSSFDPSTDPKQTQSTAAARAYIGTVCAGLADRIVDLVETGSTLKAHDLVEVDMIARSTARFIANRASLKLKHAPLMDMISRLRKAVAASQKAPSMPRGTAGSKRASTSAKGRA